MSCNYLKNPAAGPKAALKIQPGQGGGVFNGKRNGKKSNFWHRFHWDPSPSLPAFAAASLLETVTEILEAWGRCRSGVAGGESLLKLLAIIRLAAGRGGRRGEGEVLRPEGLRRAQQASVLSAKLKSSPSLG